MCRNDVNNLCCIQVFFVYVCICCVNAEWHRVEQEIMARIVCEMHDRQRHIHAVQSQLNPGRTLLHHVSDASSLASDVESTDDPVIGLWQANEQMAANFEKLTCKVFESFEKAFCNVLRLAVLIRTNCDAVMLIWHREGHLAYKH